MRVQHWGSDEQRPRGGSDRGDRPDSLPHRGRCGRAPAELPDSGGAFPRAQRLNTERKAAVHHGHRAQVTVLYSIPVPTGVHHRSPGARPRIGARSPGHGAPRQLFSLYSINQKPTRSPVVLSLSLSLSLSVSLSFSLSLSLSRSP